MATCDLIPILSGPKRSPRPNPIRRAPLPPFPPGDYSRDLPQPLGPISARIWRGNFCGVTIPGLPRVDGGPSNDICLAPFLDRWTLDWQRKILYEHALCGYTHELLWWPDSHYGNNQSVSQFVSMLQRVKSAGFYTAVNLLSKVYDPKDSDWDGVKDRILPIMQAMTGAGVLDCALVGMELDTFNIPGEPLQTIIDGVCNYLVPRGVMCYVHFSPEKTWWGADGSNRFAWWDAQRGKLQGLCYQCMTNWSIQDMQGHIADTRIQFASQPFDMVIMENKAEAEFYGDCDELTGDFYGYLSLCGPSGAPTCGYDNGGRLPDGDPL